MMNAIKLTLLTAALVIRVAVMEQQNQDSTHGDSTWLTFH